MHNNNNQSGWVLLQLLEKYRAVDVDDYQRVKDELAAIQVVFALIGPEVCAVFLSDRSVFWPATREFKLNWLSVMPLVLQQLGWKVLGTLISHDFSLVLPLQKHDQETVAELVVTKKEVEVLKVTVSRIEEERETKGSRLVELEARVTELDQKLQEAVQAEV